MATSPDRAPEREQRRWTIFRIDRGTDEFWTGVDGPPTNPPDDCGLTGVDWLRAAEVEVIPANHPALLSKEEARVIALGHGDSPEAWDVFRAVLGRLREYAGDLSEEGGGG